MGTGLREDAIVEGGANGSKGLRLYDGQSISSPVNNALYTGYKFWMRLVNEGGADVSGSRIKIETKYSDGNWYEIGLRLTFSDETQSAGSSVDLYSELAKYYSDNNYLGIRLLAYNFPEDVYVIIDDVEATTQTPLTYIAVEGSEAVVRECTHTFQDLEPDGNYYVSVQAHDDGLYSPTITKQAFGIAAPDGLEASDIDRRGSYTARWNEVPKATRYIVQSYGLTEVSEAGGQYLVEEYFDKIDESVTSVTDPAYPEALDNSYTDTDLDDYTSATGWKGRGNAIVQGMLGVQENPYDFNYVQTPSIDGTIADEIKVEFKAYGLVGDPMNVILSERTGDPLEVLGSGTTTYQYFDFVQIPGGMEGLGVTEGEMTFQSAGPNARIWFLTRYGSQMLLDYVIVSCDVKESTLIPTLLETAEVDSPDTEYGFSGLPVGEEYDLFGFSVNSVWDFNGETAYSDRSTIKTLDLAAAISDLGYDGTVPVEVARYSIDGRRLDREVKGVNIIRYSDGSTRKVIVK